MVFTWKRRQSLRHRVTWELFGADGLHVGVCYYLPGSRVYRASCPWACVCAGTSRAARKRLEEILDKHSIGLFGVDDIDFVEA